MAFTQDKNGNWIPAQPLPYYRDSRSIWLKLYHSFLCLGMLFCWTKQKREKYSDWLDKITDKYMVPVEPYTDENGNWHRW